MILFLGNMRLLKKSSSSQIWSLDKKKWRNGPVVPSKYDFINSCALALNSSIVLFVGVNIIKADEISNSLLMVDFLSKGNFLTLIFFHDSPNSRETPLTIKSAFSQKIYLYRKISTILQLHSILEPIHGPSKKALHILFTL